MATPSKRVSFQIRRRKPPTERKLREDPYFYYCEHCGENSPQFASFKGAGCVDHHQKHHPDCGKFRLKTCTRREPMLHEAGAEAASDDQDDDEDGDSEYVDSDAEVPANRTLTARSLAPSRPLSTDRHAGNHARLYDCEHCDAGPWGSFDSCWQHHKAEHPDCPFVNMGCIKAIDDEFQPRITGRPRTSKRIWTKEDNIKRKARRQRNRSAFGTSEAPFGRSANLDTGTSPELSSEEEERPAKRRQVEKPHVPRLLIRPPPPLPPSSLVQPPPQPSTIAVLLANGDSDPVIRNFLAEHLPQIAGDTNARILRHAVVSATDEVKPYWSINPECSLDGYDLLHTEDLYKQGWRYKNAGLLGGSDQAATIALTFGLGYLEDIHAIDVEQSPGEVRKANIKRSHSLLGGALAVAGVNKKESLNGALELVHLAFRHCDEPVEDGNRVISEQLLVFFGRLDNAALSVLQTCLASSTAQNRHDGEDDGLVVERFVKMELEKAYVLVNGGFFPKCRQFLVDLV